MIIENATIKMHANHQQSQKTVRTESLRVWHNPSPPQTRPLPEVTHRLSEKAR